MEEITRFLAGFRRFQAQYFGKDESLYRELAKGQQPKALVVACSDSRVDPALLTDCAPGELFVVRNVANLVPPCEPDRGMHGVSAALEFGVCDLEVRHIIVLGHSQCGGIGALMEDRVASGFFVNKWVGIAHAARDRIRKELGHKPVEMQHRACEQAAILLSLENLLTFPFVRERVDAGNLFLHGWYFDLEQGELRHYDPDKEGFVPLVPSELVRTVP